MHNSTARSQSEKKYHHLPKDDNLPLAIGAQFHDDPLNRDTLRKSHNLMLDKKIDYAPHTSYNFSGFRGENTRNNDKASTQEESTTVWDGWYSEELTDEEKKDFTVRMLGFFREKVDDSALEKERVRKVCLLFFTKDNSISITEVREANSGITQSKILSRRQVPKDPSNPDIIFTIDDFNIGSCVNIYGILYEIVDMDSRSRKFFKEVKNIDVPPAQSIPVDDFTISRKNLSNTGTRAVTSDDMDLRRVAEQQLTGIFTKRSNEDLAIAAQFFKNKINEHLSFAALWDDRKNISGDLHFCVLRLYLENFAIEIVEIPQPNSGRSGGPILVSRQRIPKSDMDLATSRFQQDTYGKLMKNNYYTPEDFQIGETYTIFGKPFYIYNCDDSTRKYMKDNFNIEMKEPIDITPFTTENEKKPVLFYPPPPNGFGSETEKRDNWLKLEGKTARLDQEKIHLETGRVMKFLAKLANPTSKDDDARRFLISFYRETDEIEITEKPVRNSGYLGGRFLAKGKHRKELKNGATVPFQPEDFEVGKEVIILKRHFLLLEMDEETKRIVAGTDKAITEDRIKYLVLLMKQQISLKFKKAHEAYKSLAPRGTLGYQQILEFMRSCSCVISEEEAVLIVQNIAPNSNGVIGYEDFLSIVNAGVENMDEASLSARTVKNVNINVNQTLKGEATTHATKLRRRELKQMLQQKLIQRKGTTQEQFRLLSEHSANSRLNRDVFRRSLNEVMHFNVPPADEDVLVSMLFDGNEDENGDINFKQFQDFIDSNDY